MEHDVQIATRIPETMLERIDAFAEVMRKTTGLRVSRNEAVRVLLGRALDTAPEIKRRKR